MALRHSFIFWKSFLFFIVKSPVVNSNSGTVRDRRSSKCLEFHYNYLLLPFSIFLVFIPFCDIPGRVMFLADFKLSRRAYLHSTQVALVYCGF